MPQYVIYFHRDKYTVVIYFVDNNLYFFPTDIDSIVDQNIIVTAKLLNDYLLCQVSDDGNT
jgi:hypothetical protein